MSLIPLVYAIVSVAFFCGGVILGYRLHDEPKVETKSPKKYVSKYRAGDLLDPITPQEQRLDKKLEK